jgi:hypothetical protein
MGIPIEIPIESPMLRAFRAGEAYQPAGLEPETGDPEATTRNLGKLCEDRAILAVVSSGTPDRGVLIVFKTGEVYFAAGFQLGPALARFLVEHTDGDWSGDYDEMLEQLETWPDMPGPVTLPRE